MPMVEMSAIFNPSQNSMMTPLWSFMNEDYLQYIRLALGSAMIGGLLYDAYLTGIEDFAWWYSDWGSAAAIITWFFINYAYFVPVYDEYYDYFIGSLFEVTYVLEMVISLMYWLSYY